MHIRRIAVAVAVSVSIALAATTTTVDSRNLVANGELEQLTAGKPTGFTATGAAEFGLLGDVRRDIVSHGYTLRSDKPAGDITARVTGLSKTAGRWYRFTVRGLPQQNFAVDNDNLYLKAAFFGDGGKTQFDAKEKKIYDQIELDRKDLAVNGVRKVRGAEVWRTYQIDFRLPFPEVDTVKLSVGFSNGSAKGSRDTAFLVDDFSLINIPDPADAPVPPAPPLAIVPKGDLLPVAGRWFYAAKPGESAAPKTFDSTNADRLLYKDAVYSAPFAGNTSAWLLPGFMDLRGTVVSRNTLINDNVTITFDEKSMVIKTHGVPNHPTGRFPEQGFGNPSYIQERVSTYYFPIDPKENPQHRITDEHNSNGALHMGPIGLAVNGVVFFNPFDMGNVDATNLMDRCCGHPNQENQYHYHKYPICVNSPWADEGKTHSPLLGWAFDGYPLYGPYEAAGKMAKDETGDRKLNEFNMHFDPDRGWHYHVTPGKFPYLIGGFWGEEDPRNRRRGGPPNGGPPGQGQGGGGTNNDPRGPRDERRGPPRRF